MMILPLTVPVDVDVDQVVRTLHASGCEVEVLVRPGEDGTGLVAAFFPEKKVRFADETFEMVKAQGRLAPREGGES